MTAIFTFLLYSYIRRIDPIISFFDAIGLALFTITAEKMALHLNTGKLAAIICAIITGVGGGVIRDIFANRVPYIFKKELYTVSAISGALLYLFTSGIIEEPWHSLVSMFCIVAFRYSAMTFDWRLPIKKI